MNREQNFWAHVDRSGGAQACWLWLLSCDRAARGRFRFEGVIRPVHHIVFYLEYGLWPRPREIGPCPRDPACCNIRHLVNQQPRRRRSFARARQRTQSEITKQHSLASYISRLHPDLTWLTLLLGGQAGQFLSDHEGQEIILRMVIPCREQLIAELRAVDCHLRITGAKPEERRKIATRLAQQYQCSAPDIETFAMMGQKLLSDATNEEIREHSS